MKRFRFNNFFIISFIVLFGILSLACTTFILKDKNTYLFGRNLDWHTGSGFLIVNPKNYEKTALVDDNEKPLVWVAKYGSVTFNQIGRDLPFGGINEKGLVVENLTLKKTRYPDPDERKAISTCQWIQYQLDNCAAIEDVIATDKILRIVDKNASLHFLICDRFGKTAVIEFLEGKMVVNAGSGLSANASASANSTYKESIESYKSKRDNTYNRSLYNFCTAASKAEAFKSSGNRADIDYAFNTLELVSQGNFTKWSIVYDVNNMMIYFKIFETPTLVGNQLAFYKDRKETKEKCFDLKRIDFSSFTKARIADLGIDREGMINDYFIDYSTKINKEYIARAFSHYKTFGGPNIEITDELINTLAEYPDSFIYKKSN